MKFSGRGVTSKKGFLFSKRMEYIQVIAAHAHCQVAETVTSKLKSNYDEHCFGQNHTQNAALTR